MEVLKEESKVAVEPQFLSQALASGIKLHIGQMNKTEFEGIIREIGRYEINLDAGGKIVTLLKQEISYLTAPHVLLAFTAPQAVPAFSEQVQLSEAASARPNIQQEFLDKAIKENQALTLYLINGQRIKGHIEAYDSFTILLKEGGKQHLFYKHSITTINR
ncbi:MAG TPA: RNA chaperone Hfq [Nitrospirota bacterium]|nr:RNA chaperone Hfq [Nitrospirota bacterium]